MGVSGATGMKYPGARVKSFLLPYHPLSSQLLVAKFSDRPKGWGRGHIYRGCGAPPGLVALCFGRGCNIRYFLEV